MSAQDESLELSIDIDRLIASAQMASGNFAPFDPGLRTRLEQILASIHREAVTTLDRRLAIELQLRKLLVTRLQLASDRARLPEIAEEKIERPIFVIGFARSGTTLSHSLLAEDVGARAPLWWHTHSPSPPPGEVPVVPERIEVAARELDKMIDMTPGLLGLHPYWDKRSFAPIEDQEIIALDFHYNYPTLLYNMPTADVVTEAKDEVAAYAFHRSFLQQLQWRNRPGHWVAKGIFHQFQLKNLFDTYPDALCIWPHRDPKAVWPSTLAVTAVLHGAINGWDMDFTEMGPAFLKSIASLVNTMLDDPLVDDPRIVHVGFEDLVHDPVATIKSAYGHWGLPVAPEFEANMRGWLTDPSNRPDRYGRYNYTPVRFGLTSDDFDNAFASYRKRFSLA